VKLALGTVQFGLDYGIANQQGQVPVDEAGAILDLAFAHGVDTLDTAVAYGNCEQRLGEIGVGGWRVISKLPAIPDGCKDIYRWVADEVTASLRRLHITCLSGLLLHRPRQLLEDGGDRLYKVLQQLKDEGRVQKIGVSIYEPAELDELFDRYQLDLVQAPFNILDGRLIDSGWLARLPEQGVELHVRSIFLQGLLLMHAGERPKKFHRWQTIWEC
jgi:aryl-alcohol dehydrogenase-like predicted oxidoreductase